MLFHTIWSVDLGKSALKAVKLRRDRSNVEILAIDRVDYPLTSAGAAAGPDAAAQAKEALSVFRARNEVKEPLIVAHPGQGTFSRFIKIPAFDQKKIKDMVRYEASQQIPFPLDEVIWDYHIIERDYMSGEERDVGLFAVRKEAIDDFLVDFAGEGLSVEMLTIGYLGNLNLCFYDIRPEEPAILLDIGAGHTDLIFVDGKRFWVRPLPHSGSDITRAIMSRFKLDFPEAEKVKVEAAKAPKQAAKIFQAVIQPKLQELVQEVHRAIGFYRSQSGEVKFTHVYLMGNGSKIIGIKKYLEEHLQIPVSRLDSISRLRVNRDVNIKLLQNDLPGFASALGCGIQAVGLGACNVDLIPKEEKIRKEINRKKKHVFFAAGIVLLAVLAAGALTSKKVDQAKRALTAAQEDMPRLYPRDVKKAQEEAKDVVSSKMDALRAIAEHRPGSLAALRTVEEVFADIPNAKVVDRQVGAGDDAAIKEALDEAATGLMDKVWIPYFNMVRVEYPEDPGARKAAKEKRPTVPAYKVSAYVVVKARENDVSSTAAIGDLFVKPLERRLRGAGATVVREVKVLPGTSGLRAIYYEPGRGTGLAEEIQQVGGPFYGAPVEWWMVPRNPPEPEVAATETKDTQPR